MDLKYLHKKLLPCDVDSPYVFISYSSEDKELVWSDVVELQSRGYNLWIDEANIDKTKDSWKDDALTAIESSNCILLAFYVSHSSLSSDACLNEIERTRGKQTIRTHFGKVDFFAIECEKINNIGNYIQSRVSQIKDSNLGKEIKDKLIPVLFDFSKKWFTQDNKKVRIHPKIEHGRISDYYEDIEKELCRHQRGAKFKLERLYRFAVKNIVQNELYYAIRFLTIGSEQYAPSALLLAHFLQNEDEYLNPKQSMRLWDSVAIEIPSETWGQRGKDEECRKCYSEAIAWYLAYGEKYKYPEYIYEASKNWVKKGCKEQTIAVLKIAASMGYGKASLYLPKLQMKSTNEFLEKACEDEALL